MSMEVIFLNELKALSLTLLVGIFFLIGIIIPRFIKKKRELTLFSTALAFIVMLSMILFDIIPEIGEILIFYPNGQKWSIIIGFTLLGLLILKGLDYFIPHHHHEHKEHEKNTKEHNEHLFHIGFVTSLSLILHNILEGLSIYTTGVGNIKAGLMIAIAVSLHNIPLGMEISVGLESSKSKKNIKIISIILLTLSSFIGSSIFYLFEINMSNTIKSCILCTTFGMLLYISLFELLREIWTYKKDKMTYIGIATGIILSIVMVLL